MTALGLSCSTQAQQLCIVRGLSCPFVCGILVPQPGVKLVSPALESKLLATGPPWKSPNLHA